MTRQSALALPEPAPYDWVVWYGPSLRHPDRPRTYRHYAAVTWVEHRQYLRVPRRDHMGRIIGEIVNPPIVHLMLHRHIPHSIFLHEVAAIAKTRDELDRVTEELRASGREEEQAIEAQWERMRLAADVRAGRVKASYETMRVLRDEGLL